MKKIAYWEAVATLVGTIVGAGILALPYVISRVGVWPGIIMIVLLGLAAMTINLMFAEIVLRTREQHQVAGYTKKYLGIIPYRIETISTMVGGFGAMTTYLIGEGQVLAALFHGNPLYYSLGFYLIGIIILFVGLKIIKVFELWMAMAFIALILLITVFSGVAINFSNVNFIDLSKIFLPYGVILFAFSGVASVVPLREILRGNEKKVRSAVFTASFIPMVIYIIFSFVAVGVTGLGTTSVATIGLGNVVGPYMLVFGNLFAAFAMGTSFLSIGLTLKCFFIYDMRFSKSISWLTIAIVPLVVFALGSKNFITTIEFVGSFTFGVSGILLVAMYWKAKEKGDRQPEFSLPKLKLFGSLLTVMFILGLAYTLYDFFLK